MRIAVISDMHGNDLAFEAAIKNQSWITSSVLKTRRRVDRRQLAGVFLRRLRRPVVMGNADAWLVSGEGDVDFIATSSQRSASSSSMVPIH